MTSRWDYSCKNYTSSRPSLLAVCCLVFALRGGGALMGRADPAKCKILVGTSFSNNAVYTKRRVATIRVDPWLSFLPCLTLKPKSPPNRTETHTFSTCFSPCPLSLRRDWFTFSLAVRTRAFSALANPIWASLVLENSSNEQPVVGNPIRFLFLMGCSYHFGKVMFGSVAGRQASYLGRVEPAYRPK